LIEERAYFLMSEQINPETKKPLKSNEEADKVELKTIEIRLSGIKDSTHRSRFVFIIMTIMAAAILISLWNGMLSWDRGMAFEERTLEEGKVTQLIIDNRTTVTNEWLKNLVISVGLLGIRISLTDLAVIGSASLIIIMVWFFFSQRRENRAIVGLLRYCSDKFKSGELSKEVCNLVYEGVVQSIVFIDMGGGDQPIKGLVAGDSGPTSQPTETSTSLSDSKAPPKLFVRRILKGLVFLPPVTILMIFISDISSLFIPSYLRDNHKLLCQILFDGEHNIAVVKIILFDLFALISCRYTWYLCRRCREFSEATSETIQEYNATVLS
jgi:hypothetical protein